jgi:hypothetical protein
MISIRKVVLAPSVGLLLTASLPRAAVAANVGGANRIASEPAVAACIYRASRGRGWLQKTLWGLRDQEGGWVGAVIANANGSDDLGPLQINSWWVPRIADLIKRPEGSVRSWLVHDACFNVDVARWIFLSALATSGSYWTAIGLYHSRAIVLQKRYAAGVAWHVSHRYGPRAFTLTSRKR